MPDAREVETLSSKMHRLLGDLTTQEANATVRRCRGQNGMLAWMRLTAIHNPKTLASGLKALMSVRNPPKICDVKRIDIQIEEWETKMESLAVEIQRACIGQGETCCALWDVAAIDTGADAGQMQDAMEPHQR